MNKRDHDNISPSVTADDNDTSTYIIGDEGQLDLGGLFSSRFSNIRLSYSSPTGPTEIHTATRYGRRFVLKGLREQFRNDPIYNLALAKEFEIGMSLEHPNIRRTIGLETVEGIGQVIVLEYVDGTTLASLIRTGGLTQASARSIAEQITDALAYMHGKQVCHRDLKPSNILVSHHGDIVRLIDFNLSDSDDFIVLKNPAGSRGYMAPELFTGTGAPTPSADIYSLGVILSELAAACGDEELAAVAARCTTADPARRPQSVGEIRLPSSHPGVAQSFKKILSSKALTYILVGVCTILAAADVYMFIR